MLMNIFAFHKMMDFVAFLVYFKFFEIFHQNQWDFEALCSNPINSVTFYQESARNQNHIQSIKIH